MTIDLIDNIDRPDEEQFAGEAEAPAVAESSSPAAEPQAASTPPAASDSPEPAATAPAPTEPVKAAAEPAPREHQVPLAVLLKERERSDARMASLEAEIQQLKKGAGVTQEEKQSPEYLDDPKGYTDAKVNEALEKLAALEKQGQEKISALDKTTQEIHYERAVESAQAQIAAKHPDILDALAHNRNIRAQQWAIINPQAPQDAIIQAVLNEERQMAADQIKAGRNPYEIVYQFAKASGYQPKAAPNPAPNGQLRAPAPANAPGAPKQMPADMTLAKAGGSPAPADDQVLEDDADILGLAISERFGRKRA